MGPEQQSSFGAVIDKLTNLPVLAYADYTLPYKVYKDASLNGLGAFLYQTQEGVVVTCALWSPAGKGMTSWLSFVVSNVSLSLSHWYPGSGVVLNCIDS